MHIVEEKKIWNFLCFLVKENRLPNSLLISSYNQQLAEKYAYSLAREIILSSSLITDCEKKISTHSHPDITEYFPEGVIEMHSINSMRSLTKNTWLKPFSSLKKVFIIYKAEKMSVTSATTLLKVLEEPNLDTFIILTTEKKEKLLPTLISRLQIFFIPSKKIRELSSKEKEFLQLLKNFPTPIEQVTSFITEIEKERNKLKNKKQNDEEKEFLLSSYDEMFINFLEIVLLWYRDVNLIYEKNLATFLFFKEEEKYLKNSFPIPLISVYNLINKALISLEKRTSKIFCLEWLFIQLDLITKKYLKLVQYFS